LNRLSETASEPVPAKKLGRMLHHRQPVNPVSGADPADPEAFRRRTDSPLFRGTVERLIDTRILHPGQGNQYLGVVKTFRANFFYIMVRGEFLKEFSILQKKSRLANFGLSSVCALHTYIKICV
jgi:hypothetical protein